MQALYPDLQRIKCFLLVVNRKILTCVKEDVIFAFFPLDTLCQTLIGLFCSFLSFNSTSEVNNLLNFVGNDSKSTWNEPVETSYHGRQLLAVVEKEGDKSRDVSPERNESKSNRFNKVQRKPEYWVDDMVESYKKEHINRYSNVNSCIYIRHCI